MVSNNEAETPSEAQESQPGTEEQPVHVAVDANRLKISTVVVATVGVLAVIFISYLVYRTLHLLLLLFLALLVATAIEPVVNRLRRGPLNRSAGILVVYTGIFVVLGTIGYITVPVILAQASDIGDSLRRTVVDSRRAIECQDAQGKTIPAPGCIKLSESNPFIYQQATVFLNVAERMAGNIDKSTESGGGDPITPENEKEVVENVTTTAFTVAEVLFAVITIFVVAFYWLTERTLIKRAVMSWFPAKRANRIRRVWDDIEVKVGGWVRGQLTLMAIVGVISAVGYFVIGVQYWPALALFIAVAEAIPLVGPYIGTAPAVLVALTQPGGGIDKALIVVAFAVVLQTIEGNVLIPRIMKNSVGISPLVVIVSILFGAVLAGLAGALVAVPLAGALQVIVQDIKAARESEEKFEAATEAAQATRADDGELVVARPADGETKTAVESTAAKA
jgi:predicted PurR-regulated permease PerM